MIHFLFRFENNFVWKCSAMLFAQYFCCGIIGLSLLGRTAYSCYCYSNERYDNALHCFQYNIIRILRILSEFEMNGPSWRSLFSLNILFYSRICCQSQSENWISLKYLGLGFDRIGVLFAECLSLIRNDNFDGFACVELIKRIGYIRQISARTSGDVYHTMYSMIW